MLIQSARRAAASIAAAVSLALYPIRAAADGGVDFTHLAPPKPVVVLTVPDFARLHSAFDASELGKLWIEPAVQKFVEEMTSDASQKIGDFLKDLGAEFKDIKPPTGTVGLALYMPETTGADKTDPHHKQTPKPFFAADAGENAQSWKDLIDKLVDKGVKDKKLTTDEDTYAGVKISILKPTYEKPKEKPATKPAEDEEDGGPLEPPQSGFAKFVGGSKEHPEALHLAWSGSTVIGATDAKMLERAIDAMQGKESDSLAQDTDFKAAAAQHPSDTQAAFYMNVSAVLTSAIEETFSSRAGIDDGPNAESLGKVMTVLGLDRVKWFGAGFKMETADGATETSLGLLAPEKAGLLNLMSDPLGAFDPPGFVSPDSASVTRLSFRFDKVYDVLRQIAGVLPEEDGKQFSAVLDQGVNLVKPGLDSLGPNVYLIGSYKQPLAHDSQLTLVAIDVKDQGVVSNTLGFFAAQAQGLAESREFDGNTIYTVAEAGMSVGLGFNRLFIGQTAAVENAMRLAGRPDAPRISAERGFKDATSGFGQDGIMQSFSDIAQTMRWFYWTIQNADKIAEAQIEEAGLEPEQKERILKRIRDSRPAWMEKLPPLDVVMAHLGDSATELHPTADGFRGRSVMLKPSSK